MIPHQLPDHPWEEVSADYFTLCTQDYLLVVNFYSKYPPMMSKTANAPIAALKSIFTGHSIPNKLIVDNKPFINKEFIEFSKKWNFKVVTSCPKYPQSNKLAECNVQTIKKLLRKPERETVMKS